jgi:hypothetical protein
MLVDTTGAFLAVHVSQQQVNCRKGFHAPILPNTEGGSATSARGDSMNTRTLWSNVLVIVGLMAMLMGAIDPLEGSLIILPGTCLVALGAFFSKSRHRLLLYKGFILVVIGVAAMFVLSQFGGIGGDTGRSMWWGLLILPYPVGWVMSLVGAILRLVEVFKRPALTAKRKMT